MAEDQPRSILQMVAFASVTTTVTTSETATFATVVSAHVDVARRAILALLDARDFLGYQLAHAHETITDGELDAVTEQYLRRSVWTASELEANVAALSELVPGRVDADVVSTVFRCSVVQAAAALSQVRTALPSPARESALPEHG